MSGEEVKYKGNFQATINEAGELRGVSYKRLVAQEARAFARPWSGSAGKGYVNLKVEHDGVVAIYTKEWGGLDPAEAKGFVAGFVDREVERALRLASLAEDLSEVARVKGLPVVASLSNEVTNLRKALTDHSLLDNHQQETYEASEAWPEPECEGLAFQGGSLKARSLFGRIVATLKG